MTTITTTDDTFPRYVITHPCGHAFTSTARHNTTEQAERAGRVAADHTRCGRCADTVRPMEMNR